MPRGFEFAVGVASADELTAAIDNTPQGPLTGAESAEFMPAAIKAAMVLVTALADHGPFYVRIHGLDNLALPGETTTVSVLIETRADTAEPAPAPVPAPAPAPAPEPAPAPAPEPGPAANAAPTVEGTDPAPPA